jgi:cytochrome c oxidase subunit 2
MLPCPKRFLRVGGLLIIIFSVLLLTACEAYDGPQTTLDPQGSSSRTILDLYNIILIMAAIVFVVVEGLLVYSVVRYRRRPEDGIPLQIHGNKPIEIAWTIIPALIVLFLATWTFRTQSLLVQPVKNPLRVTVVGHQWWWEFRYPDYQIVTANELHLPGNRGVEFSLESADVIHSFWIPRLSGKTDVIPGHINTLTFTPQETKTPLFIRGECAEFCGGTHAQMGMYAVVEPQAQFDAWVKQQQTKAQPPAGVTQAATATAAPQPNAQSTSPQARGYALFKTKGCIGCHAIAGYPEAKGQVGPNLTHVASRSSIVAGWLRNTPANLQRWLRDPNAVKPDNIMGTAIKAGTLKEDEIAALSAYLESLK